MMNRPVGIILMTVTVVLLVAALPIGIVKCSGWNIWGTGTVQNRDQDKKKAGYPYTVKVYLHDSKQVVSLALEDYIKCVTTSEMPAAFDEEALKAQAVAARTYAVAKQEAFGESGNSAHPAAALCDDVHCQVYRDKETIEKLKSQGWMDTYWSKIESAIDGTAGEVMTYQGELVSQALFYSSSGGQTENAEDVFSAYVPYLRSVASPYEEASPHQNEEKQMSLKELSAAIKKAKYGDTGKLKKSNIEILARNQGGSVEKIKLGKLTLKGRDVRSACELRSSNFDIKVSENNITFITNGYGHGVGMSQWGADGMAKQGFTYEQILTHYYSGVQIQPLGEVLNPL